jgi:hypothetical protein
LRGGLLLGSRPVRDEERREREEGYADLHVGLRRTEKGKGSGGDTATL